MVKKLLKSNKNNIRIQSKLTFMEFPVLSFSKRITLACIREETIFFYAFYIFSKCVMKYLNITVSVSQPNSPMPP